MSKFGDLIDVPVPVLLSFYNENDKPSAEINGVIHKVATILADKARVIKIDVDKNEELAEALRIKGLPTLIIYKDGEMVWRQSGKTDANTLIEELQK